MRPEYVTQAFLPCIWLQVHTGFYHIFPRSHTSAPPRLYHALSAGSSSLTAARSIQVHRALSPQSLSEEQQPLLLHYLPLCVDSGATAVFPSTFRANSAEMLHILL